ncbi:MAG: hypothetical protein IPG86_02915 [Chitinophagaceae bacterium]|nr:hypothetical protein [Chitinophagaceae bacterium]
MATKNSAQHWVWQNGGFRIYPDLYFPDQLQSGATTFPNRNIRKFSIKHTQGPRSRAGGMLLPPLRQAPLVRRKFMGHYHKMIQIFKRINLSSADSHLKENGGDWFEHTSDYIDFRNQFISIRRLSFDELNFIHEHYGDYGNFIAFTKHHEFKDAFKVVNEFIDSEYNFSKGDLEHYFETISVCDSYLLYSYKFINDVWKDPNSELHLELYQAALDHRILRYLKINNVDFSFFPEFQSSPT